jgi:hypothetical protein
MTTIQLRTTPSCLGNRMVQRPHLSRVAAVLTMAPAYANGPSEDTLVGCEPGNYASIQPRQPATAAASHLVRREQTGSPDLPGYMRRVSQSVLIILRPAAVSHDSKTARPAKSGSAVASSADTLRHSPVAGKTVYTFRLDQTPATFLWPRVCGATSLEDNANPIPF